MERRGMKTPSALRNELNTGALDSRLRTVYGCETTALAPKKERLLALIDEFSKAFPGSGSVGLYSGPGRTELGGNHTDHQHGHVLAAAVDLDAVACAGPNGTRTVRILSAGYPEVVVDLDCLTPQESERESSAALVRGIAARIAELGYQLGGFNACVSSTVLGGSGLSSSAAYEVLIGVVFNDLFCGQKLTMVQIAQIGQYAENVFFGKPCGLMDQLTSAVGGVVSIDFQDPANPVVEQVSCDPTAYGYELCIIDSGADHADLTAEYAAIPGEMGAVARCFGKQFLGEVNEADFWQNFSSVRATAGDRALLRAIHFFTDNALAPRQAQALRAGDFELFLQLVRRSGESSALHLQNLSCASRPQEQAVPLAIAAAEHLLAGRGAVRVHGGGFAGTIQAYVPLEETETFRAGMESLLGKGCCHFLAIRPVGGAVLA